ncbi:glycosyltransferase family 4 protein [Variovorax sp. LT1R16]|uniref:glycosyltransferase family 4 protein n=1 Tax=Variovorax sp. LT1R16 TaxID=3443728 RepID=UPI003F475A48
MSELAVELAKLGHKVTYVAEREISEIRVRTGWSVPKMPGVEIRFAPDAQAVSSIVAEAPANSIHICQGLRRNGMVGVAQRYLTKRRLFQWVVMETVNDAGLLGLLKRLEYRRLFMRHGRAMRGVLATGSRNAKWVVCRGFPGEKVYPFAYFLPNNDFQPVCETPDRVVVRILFVGRLVPLKRVDWIINSLAKIEKKNVELWVVGAGPEEKRLRLLADDLLSGQVKWLGQLPLQEVPVVMSQVDCLVLPSTHDGWGAVASEALMEGTSVICSDTCGVAEVVRRSGSGGVFKSRDFSELVKLLSAQIDLGVTSDARRNELKVWGRCLSAKAGARYLSEIVGADLGHTMRPSSPPWGKNA